MTTEKLPEWPDRAYFAKVTEYGPAMTIYGEADYKSELARAALARMEDARDVLQAIVNSVPFTHMHAGLRERAVACIAACARKEAGR